MILYVAALSTDYQPHLAQQIVATWLVTHQLIFKAKQLLITATPREIAQLFQQEANLPLAEVRVLFKKKTYINSQPPSFIGLLFGVC